MCVLCVLGVCCPLLVSRSTGWRTWLEEHIVYRALRTVGPALREECLPTSTNGPRLENVSIAVVTLNGAKDELYQVIMKQHRNNNVKLRHVSVVFPYTIKRYGRHLGVP